MAELPIEIMDMIAGYLQQCRSDYPEPIGTRCSSSKSWKRDIASLRLVNSRFYAAFSHLLFQQIECNLELVPEKDSKRLDDLVSLSRSHIAGYVEILVIALKPAIDLNSWSETDNAIQDFLGDFSRCLSLCIQACRNIESLEVVFLQGSSDFKSRRHDLPVNAPIKYWTSINTTIAVILTQVNLRNLQHLTLDLPGTAEFEVIVKHTVESAFSRSQNPLGEVLSRLSSLNLTPRDQSGEGGQQYINGTSAMLEDESAIQKCYKEESFNIAAVATDLESLNLVCTIPLNFNTFVTNKLQKLKGLKKLALTRMEVSGELLMRFLAESSTTLETISLIEMEINSQQPWGDVFEQLYTFPHLRQARFQSCSYTEGGPLASLRWRSRPKDYYYPRRLESRRVPDHSALRKFTRMINQRAGTNFIWP